MHVTRTKVFSEKYKCDAVKPASQPDANESAIAGDLGIGVNLLRRWYHGLDEGEEGEDRNVVAVALANKNASIAWALLAHNSKFRSDHVIN